MYIYCVYIYEVCSISFLSRHNIPGSRRVSAKARHHVIMCMYIYVYIYIYTYIHTTGPLALLTHGGDPGIVGLEWVGASDLFANESRNFHPFAQDMIAHLIHSGILPTSFF